jgi:hypothetical protein
MMGYSASVFWSGPRSRDNYDSTVLSRYMCPVSYLSTAKSGQKKRGPASHHPQGAAELAAAARYLADETLRGGGTDDVYYVACRCCQIQ